MSTFDSRAKAAWDKYTKGSIKMAKKGCFAYNVTQTMIQNWGTTTKKVQEKLWGEKTLVFQDNTLCKADENNCMKDDPDEEELNSTTYTKEITAEYDMCDVCGFQTGCMTANIFWNRHGGRITTIYGMPEGKSTNGLFVCVSDRVGTCRDMIRKYPIYPITEGDLDILEMNFIQ